MACPTGKIGVPLRIATGDPAGSLGRLRPAGGLVRRAAPPALPVASQYAVGHGLGALSPPL
jgi:hypothetical protein